MGSGKVAFSIRGRLLRRKAAKSSGVTLNSTVCRALPTKNYHRSENPKRNVPTLRKKLKKHYYFLDSKFQTKAFKKLFIINKKINETI